MSARDELREALDGLDDAQVETLAAWARLLRREPHTAGEERTMGALADALGIVAEVQEGGRSRLRLEVDPTWHNPNGVLHGGVVYTLIDYGMGGAVMHALPEGDLCTTIEAKVSYLAPVREGTLIAETETTKLGRNIAFTETKVRDQDGRLVATATGSMFILRKGR